MEDYELDLWSGQLYKQGRKCGTLRPDGYIEMRIGKGRRVRMTRVVWEFLYGSIPEGMVVDHIDNNPANNCPFNLQLLSVRDNVTKDKKPASGHHHIYRSGNSYLVQIKGVGKGKRFKSINDAIIYRNSLLKLV